jgi:hypothetical protein
MFAAIGMLVTSIVNAVAVNSYMFIVWRVFQGKQIFVHL